MVNQAWKRGRILLTSMIGVLALTMLTLWGCGGGGGSSYDTPSTAQVVTKTDTALIDAVKLKEWVDAGLVNKAGAYERVVILEVTSDASQYVQGHIPGAISVSLANLTATRLEGPAYFGAMVATGEQVDALLQGAGVDQYTTIVFTTSEKEMDANTLWNLTRGYTTLRYWGIPKARLKVLNGGNKAWMAAGYTLTTKVPSVTASNYCIAPNNTNNVQADLRASLSEMIAAVTANTKDFIDGRPAITGGTTDLVDTAKYVVFEGRIKATNSRVVSYANLVGKDKRFKAIDNYVDSNDDDNDTDKTETLSGIKNLLNIQSDTAYTLCRAGNIASVLFFAVDGYAYYDGSKKAVWYDGSWGQWGLMATNDTLSSVRGVNAGGKLPAGSLWSTLALTDLQPNDPGNTTAVSKSAAYNVDFVTALTTPTTYRLVIDITSRLSPDVSHDEATANQIEDADKAYRSPSVTPDSKGVTANAGGGC